MRITLNLLFLLVSITSSYAQTFISEILENFNNNTIEYVSVEKLNDMGKSLLLDAREKEEFEISHLKNAIWIGYETFEIARVLKLVPNKEALLVVYCSIGVRSEDIGEKLEKAGYTNVKNLYGGIFEWKNKGYPVYDTDNMETQKVHAYSKYWGSLLTNAEKIYQSKKETIGQKEQ
ncbi:rhodanese-like domain-containing protein [Flagellimonas aquimarina]|uniref:Rhodanese-like domain-containing protein n=1 Tax=Flagellimonas aquimarina TaxID=2201895 RepID=A0A316L3A9_9FLAO|nr:rhodanese-like domain-containing protein [Allomuricauda koreensis]PWL40316.1 rhodanese-like domain-containing protein [Allomuricauda koreensis]